MLAVAADIAPVHSLVSRVMKGLGTPDLVVKPEASPHGYTLRPSEAVALEHADVVFWVSDGLTPWLAGSLKTLTADDVAVELMETEDTLRLAFREGAAFEGHAHDDPASDTADHGSEGKDEPEVADRRDEGKPQLDSPSHDNGHDHRHGTYDPHGWLDPENAKRWLDVIAAELSVLDPSNAATYSRNAGEGKAELDRLTAEIRARLDGREARSFVVFHDAYQYFEHRFDLHAAGAIALGDATDPSPARISRIRETVAKWSVECVFAEPQFDPGIIYAVTDGAGVRVGVLDPHGSTLTLGAGLYLELLRNLTTELEQCLAV